MKITEKDALVVVDVQRDFCPGGALAVTRGDEVVRIINRLAPRFRHCVLTRDWHPANHCSFSSTPQFKDGSWPAHCVQNSPGAAFHADLIAPPGALVVNKGTHPEREAYSGFDSTSLAENLRRWGISRLFVCGLATDYCVKATAMDGVTNGFAVVLVEDACRAVDIPPGTGTQAIDEMRRAGVALCVSGDLE